MTANLHCAGLGGCQTPETLEALVSLSHRSATQNLRLFLCQRRFWAELEAGRQRENQPDSSFLSWSECFNFESAHKDEPPDFTEGRAVVYRCRGMHAYTTTTSSRLPSASRDAHLGTCERIHADK